MGSNFKSSNRAAFIGAQFRGSEIGPLFKLSGPSFRAQIRNPKRQRKFWILLARHRKNFNGCNLFCPEDARNMCLPVRCCAALPVPFAQQKLSPRTGEALYSEIEFLCFLRPHFMDLRWGVVMARFWIPQGTVGDPRAIANPRVPVGFRGFVSLFAVGSSWVPAGFPYFCSKSQWVPLGFLLGSAALCRYLQWVSLGFLLGSAALCCYLQWVPLGFLPGNWHPVGGRAPDTTLRDDSGLLAFGPFCWGLII